MTLPTVLTNNNEDYKMVQQNFATAYYYQCPLQCKSDKPTGRYHPLMVVCYTVH